jgi:hypothetical protein
MFVVLAPALLRAVNMRAGLLSVSAVDFQVSTQYFMLQVGRLHGEVHGELHHAAAS